MTHTSRPTASAAIRPGAAGPDGKGLLDCVHCGLCLSVCPTYLETGVEMASPRGRLHMIRAVHEGNAGVSRELVKHLDQCLDCLACQEMCPSGVPYGRLLEEARAEIAGGGQQARAQRLWRWLSLQLFPYPARLGWVLRGVFLYQQSGLARLFRASTWLARVAPRLTEMESLLPPLPAAAERRPLPFLIPAAGQSRGRIGLLTGCAQRSLLPQINRASARVLAAAGFDVVVPQAQGCCGALHVHAGDVKRGRALAQAMIEAFERAGVDLVAVNAAGCGAAMKGYGELLAEEPAWRERAVAFSRKVRDISELLAEVAFDGRLSPVPLTVTYHDACHLAHAQRIRREPRRLLEAIPGLRLVELAEADLCCGSAGVYNLLQPQMAGALLRRKVENVRATGADLVVAGNIGCLLHLASGLRRAGLTTRVAHPVELLDWSLSGAAGAAGASGRRYAAAAAAELRREGGSIEPRTLREEGGRHAN